MKYERIVVAIDLSTESENILSIAAAIAGDKLHDVHAIHVIEPMPVLPYEASVPDLHMVHEKISAESKLQLSKYAGNANISTEKQRILNGAPASEICRYASQSNAQLIVLGSHGVSGWRALLGSTANSVVQEAACDVLTVRVGLDKQE